MFYIGCHLSAAEGFAAMGRDALAVGANVFQFFTRNPRGGAAKDIVPADVAAYRAMAEAHGFGTMLAHASYTINPCSATPRTREFALETMADDLVRLENLPGSYYNFHPGSYMCHGGDLTGKTVNVKFSGGAPVSVKNYNGGDGYVTVAGWNKL